MASTSIACTFASSAFRSASGRCRTFSSRARLRALLCLFRCFLRILALTLLVVTAAGCTPKLITGLHIPDLVVLPLVTLKPLVLFLEGPN